MKRYLVLTLLAAAALTVVLGVWGTFIGIEPRDDGGATEGLEPVATSAGVENLVGSTPPDPIEVVGAGDVQPVARTLAMPFVTLSGSLEQRYASKNWADYSRVDDVLKTVNGILNSSLIDRSGVVLSEQDYVALGELVATHNKLVGAAYERAGSLRQAGMAKAAREGRFVAESVAPPPSFEPAAYERWRDEQASRQDEVLSRIREQHGVAEKDWRFVVTGTSKPDGIHRRVVVWFTRYQEPAFFEAYSEHVAVKEARQHDLDEFFSSRRR